MADMHQRKAEMARQSDAFIALPGESVTLSRRFMHAAMDFYCYHYSTTLQQ